MPLLVTAGPQDIEPTVYGWCNRVATAGGPAPTLTTMEYLSDFVYGCKSDGIWTKMISVNCIVPDSLNAALTPLLQGPGFSTWTNQSFVAADLSVNGLKGDGSTKFLNTGVVPATAFSNDTSSGLTLYNTFPDTSTAWNFGVANGGIPFVEFGLYFNQGGQCDFSCWDESGGLTFANISASTGYMSGNRISTSDQRIYYANNTSSHFQVGSTTVTAGSTRTAMTSSIYLYWQSFNPPQPVPGNKSAKRFSFAGIHLGLTSAESSNLFNRVQTLRKSLGGGYV